MALSLVSTSAVSDEIERRVVDGFSYDCFKGKNVCSYHERWVLYLRSDKKHVLIDKEGVGRNRLWVMANTLGKKESYLELYNFDCDQFLYRIERSMKYNDHFAKGNITNSLTHKTEWTTPPPDTLIEGLHKFNCYFIENPDILK